MKRRFTELHSAAKLALVVIVALAGCVRFFTAPSQWRGDHGEGLVTIQASH